jgi:hypothetical protein
MTVYGVICYNDYTISIVVSDAGDMDLDSYLAIRFANSSERDRVYGILELFNQLCNALIHIHQVLLGVYLDLKGTNVMVNSRTGQLQITDFGGIRLFLELSEATPVTVTPLFAAPEAAIRWLIAAAYTGVDVATVTIEILTGHPELLACLGPCCDQRYAGAITPACDIFSLAMMLKRALLPWVGPLEETAAWSIAATHPTALRVHGSPWAIIVAGMIHTWSQDTSFLTYFDSLPALKHLLSRSLAADPQQRPSIGEFTSQIKLAMMEYELIAGLKEQLGTALQAKAAAEAAAGASAAMAAEAQLRAELAEAAAKAAQAEAAATKRECVALQGKVAAAELRERQAVADSLAAAHAAEIRVKEVEADCAAAIAAAEAKAAAAEQREKAARAECAALVAAASDYVEAMQQKVQHVLVQEERAAGLHQAARQQLEQQTLSAMAQVDKVEAELAGLRALRLTGEASASAPAVQQKPPQHPSLASARLSSAAADVGVPGTPTRLSESGCPGPAAASDTTSSSRRSSSGLSCCAPAIIQRSDTRPFTSPLPVQGSSRPENPFRINTKMFIDSWTKRTAKERQQHQTRIAKREVKPWYAVFPALWL